MRKRVGECCALAALLALVAYGLRNQARTRYRLILSTRKAVLETTCGSRVERQVLPAEEIEQVEIQKDPRTSRLFLAILGD